MVTSGLRSLLLSCVAVAAVCARPWSQVYVHYTELLNFLRAAVSLLGLPADAGPSAVMATLGQLVEHSARWVGGWLLLCGTLCCC
jgi:hypothetical protein